MLNKESINKPLVTFDQAKIAESTYSPKQMAPGFPVLYKSQYDETDKKEPTKQEENKGSEFKIFYDNIAMEIEKIREEAGKQTVAELKEAMLEKYKKRKSYLYAVFSGRTSGLKKEKDKKSYLTSSPYEKDFDYGSNPQKVWMSMGLISLIINYFSARDAATSKFPMCELDIDDVIVGHHNNLISSDSDIMLIPNPQAPKFFYGIPGEQKNAGNPEWIEGVGVETTKTYFLGDKMPSSLGKEGIILGTKPITDGLDNTDNKTLKKVMQQPFGIYRDDHDIIINGNIYNTVNGLDLNRGSRSFPCKGHGYLSNIYLNVNFFVEKIKANGKKTYYDLVKSILQGLNEASANFWNLNLEDAQGKWRISDLNYPGSGRNADVSEKILVFDMHDVNNVIKSFKFRPQLSDVQATRVLYSEPNNSGGRFYEKNDANDIPYRYKDYVLRGTDYNKESFTDKRNSVKYDWDDTLRKIQNINDDYSIETCQMTFEGKDIFWGAEDYQKKENYKLFVKLALPKDIGKSILRKLLDDQDHENNQKYCAIQPGINAEITMQGIGGLRTFQCFLIRNLPEPYSEKNIVFQIINVMDHVESGNWETTLVAGIRPLRKFIIDRLKINDTFKSKL